MTEGNDNLIYAERTEMIKHFLRNANKFKPLDAETEAECFRKAKAGDKAAKDLIINSNMMFVYSIAKQYSAVGSMLEEFISEGMLGLMKAYEKFDVDRGFKFISYAVHYIRVFIEMFIYNKRPAIKLHEHNTIIINKIEKFRDEYYRTHMYDPSVQIIMEHFTEVYFRDAYRKDHNGQEPSDEMVEAYLDTHEEPPFDPMLCLNNTYMSIDGNVSGNDEIEAPLFGDDAEYTSVCHSENDAINKINVEERKKLVEELLSPLNERERDIVKAGFGLGYDFEISDDELAAKYNIGVVRVRQIRAAAMDKLRNLSDKYGKRFNFA